MYQVFKIVQFSFNQKAEADTLMWTASPRLEDVCSAKLWEVLQKLGDGPKDC